MIQRIAYYLVFGKPLIMYTGILTLLLLIFTASISMLNLRGWRFVPFYWHSRVAKITLIIAVIHGVMGLSAYFNF